MKQIRYTMRKTFLTMLISIVMLTAASAQDLSTYVTPSYTKLYGNQIEKLNMAAGPSVRSLNFSELTSNPLADHDGFMVRYETDRLKNYSETEHVSPIMTILVGNRPVLDIHYLGEDSALKIIRYYNETGSIKIEYVLFDKFMSGIDGLPVFKFYFSSDFIWVEATDYEAKTPKKVHSPLFWGLNFSRDKDNVQPFMARSSDAKLKLYSVCDCPKYTGEDIQIYSFNTTQLLKDINDAIAGKSTVAAPLALAVGDPIVKPLNVVHIYPNPVTSSQLTVSFEQALDQQQILGIEIMDLSGKRVHSQQLSMSAGSNSALVQLPSTLNKGETYIISYTCGDITGSQKIIIGN